MGNQPIGGGVTKSDLVDSLVSLRMAAIYAIFAQICLHQFIKDWAKQKVDPESLKTQLPEGIITFKQFMELLATMGNQAQVETKRNANRALTRNYLKEVFRVTESFCRARGQSSTLTSEPWYQFARIIVNSLSHNFRLEFRARDKKCLPATYKGVSLDITLDKKPLNVKLEILLSLSEDIIAFAKNKLS